MLNNTETEEKIIIPALTEEAQSEELLKKAKEYWPDDTEKSVIEYLNLDFTYLDSRLVSYVEKINSKEIVIDEIYYDNLIKKLEYSQTEEAEKLKNIIFKKKIYKPLNRLIENIVFNYKLFRPDVDLKTLHDDCVSYVYKKFSKFNPDINAKAFSYFGTIAKHYLLGEKKETTKKHQVSYEYEVVKDEADCVKKYDIEKKSELEQSFMLFKYVINNIEKEINKKDISENDKKVGEAIISIFTNHEMLKIYNKNQIYQLLKERTGLDTKEITYSLHRFKIFYKSIKKDFIKKQEKLD